MQHVEKVALAVQSHCPHTSSEYFPRICPSLPELGWFILNDLFCPNI